MSVKNKIITSKLSINRSLNQLSHIQAMFLFCEPRNISLDADITDNVIDMISKVRRELRSAQDGLEGLMETHSDLQTADSADSNQESACRNSARAA